MEAQGYDTPPIYLLSPRQANTNKTSTVWTVWNGSPPWSLVGLEATVLSGLKAKALRNWLGWDMQFHINIV